MADWPVGKSKFLTDQKYALLGVLNELGIHEVKADMKKPRRIPYYIKVNYHDFYTYQIYFQDYKNEAAEFTKTILTKVFKQKLKDLKFEIG